MATVNEKMTAIADAIRDKTGGTEALTLDGMAENVPKVYEAGKKAENKRFWDAFQKNGTRTDYDYAFYGKSWNADTFYPTHDIRPTKSTYMFNNFGSPYISMASRLKECGVVLDFSQITTSNREFYLAKMFDLPVLDFSNCTTMTSTFDYCNFKEIKLKISESGNTVFSSTFNRCSDLKTFEIVSGVIGKSISFSSSPLNVASMKNIISHLKDYAEDTANHYKHTVTFKSSAFNVLEDEGATAEYNGVACTWAELIDNKKWNLVKA